jgi:hypothetical protein
MLYFVRQCLILLGVGKIPMLGLIQGVANHGRGYPLEGAGIYNIHIQS